MAREHEEAAVWWDLNPGEPMTGPYPRPKPSCSYNLSGRTAVWLGLEQQTSRSKNFKTEALNVILLIHVVLIAKGSTDRNTSGTHDRRFNTQETPQAALH